MIFDYATTLKVECLPLSALVILLLQLHYLDLARAFGEILERLMRIVRSWPQMRWHSLLLLLIVEETVARGEGIGLILDRRHPLNVMLDIASMEKLSAIVADCRMHRVFGSLFW